MTVLNSFALNIGLPVLIFSSLSKTAFSFIEQADVIISNSIFVIGSFLLAFIIGKIFRFKEETFRTICLCLGFGNVAYLGIPTLVQVSGATIVPTASLIVAIYLFWVFSMRIGFLDFSQQQRKRVFLKNIFINLIKNPLLISVVLGIIISSLHIALPEIVTKSLDMITASVTPTVLIVIGLFIGKSRIGKLTQWIPVLVFSLIVLFALPAGFYFGVKLFGFSPDRFSASIIQAAMPLAITPFALAEKFKLNQEFIARSVVLSTILSVISIPFWISVL